MHWILQNNIFSETGWDSLVETLTRFGIPFSEHKVVPFVGELLPDPTIEGDVICFGSYSLRHVAKRKNWYPGVFDLEPQNFVVQMSHWKNHMLNWDSVVSRFEDARFPDDMDDMFVRPIDDSKHFAGKVFEREDFVNWQRNVCLLKLDYGTSLSPDTIVQVCQPHEIYSEYRFWVVRGEIVTASLYKLGDKVQYSSNVDPRFFYFVNSRISEWSPHEAFVIDVCDTPDGIKIVEINTINSSGFYAGDVQKLVFALEDVYR
jgi:hypothetical protein